MQHQGHLAAQNDGIDPQSDGMNPQVSPCENSTACPGLLGNDSIYRVD